MGTRSAAVPGRDGRRVQSDIAAVFHVMNGRRVIVHEMYMRWTG